jgi:hypothetical protein
MDDHRAPRRNNDPALAGHGAEAVRDAIASTITTLPEQLRRSLTWDQGAELAQHAQLRIDTGLQVYFCDPHSPWQRGTNENTNGLLRQYFPKGTDLSRYIAEELAAVGATLNRRPRKTLAWKTPAETSTISYTRPDSISAALRPPGESALHTCSLQARKRSFSSENLAMPCVSASLTKRSLMKRFSRFCLSRPSGEYGRL